jgi:hypothetical protein
MATGKDTSKTGDNAAAEPVKASGKGRATPTRKEREAANKRPLVPNDRKLARQQSRVAAAEARERARVGMALGEEKYLPARDRGPQKKFARDYIDARYSFGELLVPLMFIIIIWSFVDARSALSVYILWGFLMVLVVDSTILSIALRKRIDAKFGAGSMERGVRWYAIMRAIQLRVMRMPKPQVGRREYPN